MSQQGQHRVVIIGAGFGGLFAARALRKAPVSVTVIDRTNHHLFQPLLYQLATGILSEGDIAPPIRDVLRKQDNTTVRLGEVVGLDLQSRTVRVQDWSGVEEVPYDSLIVAAGAGQSYFGHDEFARYAPGMKCIDDALEIRGRIFGAFEMAEQETDPQRRQEWLTFAVVGAGPTGVEMAGQIAELSQRSLPRNFRHFDPRDTKVVLLDAGNAVLPTFGTKLGEKTQRALGRLRVDVELGAMVTDIDATGVRVRTADGQSGHVAARTVIWAAGVAASPLGRQLSEQSTAGLDRVGRVKVNDDLSLPGHPEVFVIGDMMDLKGLPGQAEVAMQGGRHAAKTIVKRIGGDTSAREFHYHDLGSMATISRFRAVASLGPIHIAGFLGWLMWLFVHLAFLTGFKNRAATLANWFIAFIGRGRPQRAITTQQTYARQISVQHGITLAPPSESDAGSRRTPQPAQARSA